MASSSPVVITRKQAKKQVNHIGRALIFYILLFSALKYGMDWIIQNHIEWLFGYDADYIRLIGGIAGMVLVMIPFEVASKCLHLKLSDYLRNPRLPVTKTIVLICIGIALYLIVVSVSMLFYFFFHTDSLTFDFLGKYNTTTNVIKNLLYVALYVIVKPIFDEIIFRGIVQRQLGHYGRYFGVLASAVLYAIAQTNLVDAIAAFVVGWYLSLITLRYHSIHTPIQVHIGICLFLFVLNSLPEKYLLVIILMILLIYVLVALFIFQKRVDTSMVRYGATEWKLWKILLTSASVIVCIVLFLVNATLSIV